MSQEQEYPDIPISHENSIYVAGLGFQENAPCFHARDSLQANLRARGVAQAYCRPDGITCNVYTILGITVVEVLSSTEELVMFGIPMQDDEKATFMAKAPDAYRVIRELGFGYLTLAAWQFPSLTKVVY